MVNFLIDYVINKRLLKKKTRWVNIKTGKTYISRGMVLNVSNNNSPELMVYYYDEDQEYVRNLDEFLQKFKRFKKE